MDPTLYGFQGLFSTYNVHPAFVHFPIALVPTMLLFYTLGIVFRSRSFRIAGRSCLVLGLASLGIAVATGLVAEDSFPHNETIHHMMETHEKTGLTALGVAVVLTIWSFVGAEQRPRAPLAFLAVGAFLTYLVLQNGDLGSRMVYLEGAAVRPAVPLVAGSRPRGEAAEAEEQEHVHGARGEHEHHHAGGDAHPHEHGEPAE